MEEAVERRLLFLFTFSLYSIKHHVVVNYIHVDALEQDAKIKKNYTLRKAILKKDKNNQSLISASGG